MTRFLVSLLAASAAVLAIGTAQVSAQTNDVLKEKHGDWEIRCIDGTDTCAMSQVGSTGDGKRALLVTIQRLQGAKADNGVAIPAAMTVQTPLGILLPYGVRLKIDSAEVVPLPLARCVPAGCISQAPMLDEAVGRMKKGSTAVFGFFLDQEIIVNVSLSGFTKAFNSLTPVSAQNR